MKPLLRGLFSTLLLLAAPSLKANPPEPDGGFSPEEAIRRMVVPPGFHVELVASEPMIRQPVAACFDERGRLWVIEYLQYPNPAGLKPVTVDQYLRTEYDRFPDPPPRGPRGVDRIKILEDTNGDGQADRATTFIEGLNLATAIAVGNGGLYVGQAPICFSTLIAIVTTGPTVIPKSCSPALECKMRTRPSTRSHGVQTAGSMGHREVP